MRLVAKPRVSGGEERSRLGGTAERGEAHTERNLRFGRSRIVRSEAALSRGDRAAQQWLGLGGGATLGEQAAEPDQNWLVMRIVVPLRMGRQSAGLPLLEIQPEHELHLARGAGAVVAVQGACDAPERR